MTTLWKAGRFGFVFPKIPKVFLINLGLWLMIRYPPQLYIFTAMAAMFADIGLAVYHAPRKEEQ